MGKDVNKIEQCKRQAKRIKSDYPELGYMQRLDVVAKQMISFLSCLWVSA